MIKISFISFFLLFIISCAPTRFVKPLDAKQKVINVALGGPLIDYNNLIIPMPFLTATYGYGFDSTTTVFGSLNLTSALYGNFQLELGATKRILKQNGKVPAISINPVANIVYRNKDAFKLYPQLDINAYWDYNKGRNFFYFGLSNWFELASKNGFDKAQRSNWLVTPMIGETFIKKRWNYCVELKIIAPNLSNQKSVVEYKTPVNNKGALGVYFSITRKL